MSSKLSIAIWMAVLTTANFAAAEEAASSCLIGGENSEVGKACLSTGNLIGKLDLTAPSNPLFTLMGSSPETVIKPAPGEKITASLLPGIADALGNEQSGFAIELRPALFLAPEKYTKSELKGVATEGLSGSAERAARWKTASAWSPVTLHLAAINSEDESSRIGLGLSYVRDSSDPVFSTTFGNCLGPLQADDWVLARAAKLVDDSQGSLSEQDALALAEKQLPKSMLEERLEIQRCSSEAVKWNRKIWSAGAAAYRTDTDAENALVDSESGYGAWFSYARPAGQYGQFLVTARQAENELSEREIGENKLTLPVDTTSLGFRYTHSLSGDSSASGLASNFIRGFIEIGYTEESFGGIDDEFSQAGLGFEFRLRQDLYLQLVVGDTFGSDLDRDTYMNGQLKWSFSASPLM